MKEQMAREKNYLKLRTKAFLQHKNLIPFFPLRVDG
jgi:hypothetical protein